ncbi:MAG: FHA domain-containing protein [Deltaproteobacteria bacterium]|nr:MAG: FHA domain-containing protein [Deltaproteobacteria bacterium]
METPQYTGQKVVYFLDIQIPDGDAHRVAIFDSVSIGSSADVEVSVEEFGLAPRHAIFKVHNDILSLHNLGGNGKTSLEGHQLQHGKMYIVEKGDSLSMGELELVIESQDIKSKEDFYNLVGQESDEEIDVDELIANDDFEEEVDKGPGLFARIKEFFAKKKEALKNALPKKKAKASGDKKKSSSEKTLTAAHQAPAIKTKNKKKLFKTSDASAAGFVGRVFAFILNLLITMNAKDFLIPMTGQEQKITELMTKVSEMLAPLILKVTAMIPASLAEYAKWLDYLTNINILTFVSLFLVLNLVGILLFGVTTGHAMVMIGGNGSLIANRITGIIRWIVGLITTPLLILDLPCLLGKRTVKELASGSTMTYRFGLAKILGPLLLFPVFATLLLLTPAFHDIDRLMAEAPEVVKIIPKKSQGELPFSGDSSVLGLHLEARKFESRELIPVLRKTPKGHHLQLQLLDVSAQNKAQLEIKNDFMKKMEIIKIGLSNNPLSFHFYQNLKTSLETDTLTPAAALEFQHLLKNAFSLQPEKLVDVVLSNGPFIGGLVQLRKTLLDKLTIAGSPTVVFRDVGAVQLIELSDKSPKANISTSILPLDAKENLGLWQLSYKKEVKEAGGDLKQIVLVKPRPLGRDKLDITARLLKETEWGPLEILDFYSFLENAEALAPGMENKVVTYYKHACQLALSIGSDFLFTQFEGRFRSNIESLEALSSERPGLGLKSMIKSLKEQLNALSAKNIKYFERSQKSAKRSYIKTSPQTKSKKNTRSKSRRRPKRK